MIKKLLFALACVGVVASMSFASTDAETAAAQAAFKKMLPQTGVNGFRPAGFGGLYEVLAGDNVFYYDPKTDYLLVGEIWAPRLGKNITAERKQELAAKKVSQLPLNKAVKIGSGKNVVFEFTDPDCPFCRKASSFFEERNDVTRYVFFSPIKEIHPNSQNKAEYILGADDQATAYREVMSGSFDKQPVPAAKKDVQALMQEHISISKKMGVTGTPQFYVNGQPVTGANIPELQRLLTAGPEVAAK